MSQRALIIDNRDNLAVALTTLKPNERIELDSGPIVVCSEVPAKHKFALCDLEAGANLYMYGTVVGQASRKIRAGEIISTGNTRHKSARAIGFQGNRDSWNPPDDTSNYKKKYFLGYHRSDGQVGTANYWLVFPLVFCENRNIEILKTAFSKALGYDRPNRYEILLRQLVTAHRTGKTICQPTGKYSFSPAEKDGKPVFQHIRVKFITHQAGCGGTRQDSEMLCRLLAGYLKNPNVAGATVLSLGCQNAEIKILKRAIRNLDENFDKPLLIFDQQQTGRKSHMLEEAIVATFTELTKLDQLERKPAPLSKLVIGLECGASDGFSGISANPVAGYVADLIAALGGKVLLAEFPELCGVEQALINRMSRADHAEKFLNLMNDYARAAENAGSGFDMNPSPGNIKDGLITDAMKSAGAAKKGGTAPVVDVLDYTEYATKPGLSLLCTPGNDVESTTGLAASGANIILFTTGLGTPTGNPVAPVIKISSNSALAAKMPDIIDFDAGPVIKGTQSIRSTGKKLLDFIIEVASGNIKTCAEVMGQDDFIPWKRGVSL